MEHTFMTIHNLTPDCNILFASESIHDILGWPSEHVRGRSVFDFFHPDEIPFARSIHSRGVLLDKAASLHYVRILAADGQWVSCECCFTVVHDVLVACTSIYRQGEKSERRALEGAQIRRIFSSSPRDPRYHMLEHLSPKFKMPPVEREPRAALILNRFTRNLTIMFATTAVASVLGLAPEQLKNKSFYRCIQERCLPDALKCLESAKANDSIAYLRFWSRDPRDADEFENVDEGDEDGDEPMNESSASDSEGGGVALDDRMDVDAAEDGGPAIKQEEEDHDMQFLPSASAGSSSHPDSSQAGPSRSSQYSGAKNTETPLTQTSPAPGPREAPHPNRRPLTPPPRQQLRRRRRGPQPLPSVELEAVVSCTSDGLVVILRRARPAIPPAHPPLALAPPWDFTNGLFAAPWAAQPVRPQAPPPEMLYDFRAPLLPQYMPLRENVKAAGGPPEDYLMRSIRDVAVFAWALVGINGTLAAYSHGRARGEAAPAEGLPVWDPHAPAFPQQQPPPHNQAEARWTAYDRGVAGVDKGKGPAAFGEQTGYRAAQSRDLPLPVFGMPGYLQNAPRYVYQAAGLAAYVPQPQPPPQQQQQQQQGQNYIYGGHASQGYAPEAWRNEQPFSVPGAEIRSGSRSPSPYASGWASGRS